MRRRQGLVALAMVAFAAACAERTQPLEAGMEQAPALAAAAAGPAAAIQVASGSGQIGLINEYLANPIVVRVVDAAGQPVANHSIAWRVTSGGGVLFNSTGARTNAEGLAQVQWRMGATTGSGTAEAYFYVSGTPITATFTATAINTGMVKSWTGALSADYLDQRNWSPEGVPTSKDTVRIGGTERDPVLAGSGSIARLEVMPGDTLVVNAGRLAVGGAVLADGAITGSGTLVMTGGANVRGRLPALEISRAPGKLAPVIVGIDSIFVNGNLTINGVFDPNGNATIVTGNLVQSTGDGKLRMLSGGSVSVDGDASFLAGGGPNALIKGTLTVRGNLTVRGIYSLRSEQEFWTRLVGTTQQQVVDVQNGGLSSNRFGYVSVLNPHGVRLVGNVAAMGAFESREGPVIGQDTLFVDLTYSARQTRLGGLSVVGAINAPASGYEVGTTTYRPSKAATWNRISILPYQNLVIRAQSTDAETQADRPLVVRGNFEIPWGRVITPPDGMDVKGRLVVGNAGTLTLGGDLTVEGNASVEGSVARLNVNGKALRVWGDMTVAASRGLIMTNANDFVSVEGSFTISKDQRSAFKAGKLYVRRHFTALAGPYSFVSEPGHEVILDGAQEQVVSIADTVGTSHFHRLTLDNFAGVRFASPRVRIRHELRLLAKMTVPAGTTVDALGYTARNSSGVYVFHPATFRFGVTNQLINEGAMRTNGFESIDGMTPLHVTGPYPSVIGCIGSGCPL